LFRGDNPQDDVDDNIDVDKGDSNSRLFNRFWDALVVRGRGGLVGDAERFLGLFGGLIILALVAVVLLLSKDLTALPTKVGLVKLLTKV